MTNVDALSRPLQIGDVVTFVSKRVKHKELSVGKIVAFLDDTIKVEGFNFYKKTVGQQRVLTPSDITGKFASSEVCLVADNNILKKYTSMFLSYCFHEDMMHALYDEDFNDYPGEWAEAAIKIKYDVDDKF